MDVRISGTMQELADLAQQIRLVDGVESISRPYPNRGDTRNGRIYIKADKEKFLNMWRGDHAQGRA